MNIVLGIPDNMVAPTIDALCARNNYQAEIDGQPNPESKQAFALRQILGQVTGEVKPGNRAALVATAKLVADAQDAAIDSSFTVAVG